jgi:hypothetical protein
MTLTRERGGRNRGGAPQEVSSEHVALLPEFDRSNLIRKGSYA